MAHPLDGVRVLDLTLGPVGGVATMVLADFGAEVIHLEPPEGDPDRALPHSPVWLRGKRTHAVDFSGEIRRDLALSLANESDVLVTTLGDAQLTIAGLSFESLAATNPGLVFCSISGWERSGPYASYPAHEGLVAAKSGRMKAFSGLPDRAGPAYAAVQVGAHAASQAAIAGILAALLERDCSGKGQRVETSLLRAMLPYDLAALIRVQLTERGPHLFANDPFLAMGRMPSLNYHPVQAADGRWLQMGNLLQHLFDNFLSASDLADILSAPEYEGSPAVWRPEVREAFRDRMLGRMRERTSNEWMNTYVDNGGVAATVYRPATEALDDPDLVANGHVFNQHVHGHGEVRQVGLVARLVETPGAPGHPKSA